MILLWCIAAAFEIAKENPLFSERNIWISSIIVGHNAAMEKIMYINMKTFQVTLLSEKGN